MGRAARRVIPVAVAALAGLLILAAARSVFAAPEPPAAEGAPDARSAATLRLPPPEIDRLRVGIVAFVKPSPFEPVLEPTLAALERTFGKGRVEVSHYTLPELEAAIRRDETDVFLASSGFFLRMIPQGARSLATVVSRDYPDPNHNDGSALVVLDERRELQTLADLKGRRLVTSARDGFTSSVIPMGEVLRAGFDPEKHFSSIVYLGGGSGVHNAFDLLGTGEADVVNVRLCFLEEWEAEHPEDKGRYRVINRKDAPGEACARSSELYPSWTLASTRAARPDVSRLVTRALLEMPPAGEKGLYWGVATDFSRIDRLFRDLKIGSYAHLREWTVRRFIAEHREWIVLALFLALGLVGHSVRVSQLVRRRTSELEAALALSQRLRAEARAAGERLERLERMGVVGQLSTIFAHEMRQPLGAISLYSFALRRLAQSGDIPAEQARAVLDKLDRQTARADEIVTRVRAYARREDAGRTTMPLRVALERAVADLKTTGRFKASIDAAPLEPVEVEADPLEIELVAVNLIKNALEALAAHPEIATPVVRVSVLKEAGRAILLVSDNSGAVDEKLLARLEGLAPSEKSEGLGLGLSIVRNIVEKHAGRLTFERSAEGGLLARVTLPAKSRSNPKADFQTDSEAASKRTSS